MANGATEWDLFLAHAGRDQGLAEELYGHINARVRVFLDSKVLRLGDDWDTLLAAAQRASLVTVVLITPGTEAAYYEREEIAAAIDMARQDRERHRVVPIYVPTDAGSPEVPYGLRLKHGLTLSEQLTLLDAAERLVELVRGLRPGGGAALDADAVVDRPGILHAPGEGWDNPIQRSLWRYKLVAFDLDGTLLRGERFVFSWEAVWSELRISPNVRRKLRSQYRLGATGAVPEARIAAYRRWCEAAVTHFRLRRLTRDQLAQVAHRLRLTKNCREALTRLRDAGIATAIVSGGLDTFLVDCFPDFRDYFDFVFINRLTFDADGVVDGVVATPYDFEGKAEALLLACRTVGCTAEETVFVGDHFNDEAIMLRADLSIAYPPMDKVAGDTAGESIETDDLTLVLPHVFVA
jgi:HAD superfamily phosphoserine phosphatase-like hydrolase